MTRVHCSRCRADTEAEPDPAGGFLACTVCGFILEEQAFSSDPSFAKGADGER